MYSCHLIFECEVYGVGTISTYVVKLISTSSLPQSLNSSENSSDIEAISGPGPVLVNRVNKHRAKAFKIHLTAKPVSSLGLTVRTKEYVKRKRDTYNAATDPKGNAPVT